MTKYLYIHRGYEKLKRDNVNEPTLALKYLYKKVNQLVVHNELESTVEFVDFFMTHNKDDISGLRMLLDVIKKVSDEPIISPLMPKLIDLIEEKIGKKLH